MNNNDAYYWENFLFGVFTTELYLDTYIEDISGIKCGFIIPSDRTMNILDNVSIGLLGEGSSSAISAEFEKEVSRMLNSLPDSRQRLSYLMRVAGRFEIPFNRIPIYNEILPKLFDDVLNNGFKDNLTLYSRLSLITNLLTSIKKILENKYHIEYRINMFTKTISGSEHKFNAVENQYKVQENIVDDKFRTSLKKLGFFDLDKVKVLDEAKVEKLYQLIKNSDTPYQIAMFKYLTFLDALNKKMNYTKINKTLALVLDKVERHIKGNVLVLSELSTENKTRYTAHRFVKVVEEDYQKL